MKIPGAFLLGLLCSAPLSAQDNPTKIVFNLDLLNRQTLTSKSSYAGTSTNTTTTETKSAKPGGLQVALFTGDWAFLANIAPDTATSGLVGGGISVVPYQYLGLAYNLNTIEYSDSTPSSRQEFYGLLGYHVIALDQGQRMTALWTLGPTYAQLQQKLPDGSQGLAHGRGSQATLTLRYQYKVSDNMALAPAIKIALTSTRLKLSGLELKREVNRLEFVPLAFQVKI